MKRFLCILISAVMLVGCGGNDSSMERAMEFRQTILQSNGCSFDAYITADYGDTFYTFLLYCEMDSIGNLAFTVKEPQSIEGITGRISEEGGVITFDDAVLAFETIADGLVTPVCAPWLIMKTLKSGYIKACGTDGDYLKIILDDSYQEESLRIDAWLNSKNTPENFDIMWKESRVLNVVVKDFCFV